MKKSFKVFALSLVAVSTLFACSKEMDVLNDKPVVEGNKTILTIKATNPESVATKTTMSGTTPSWLAGDQITVIYKNTSDAVATAESTPLAGAITTATFDATLVDANTSINGYAVYPANDLAQTLSVAKIPIAAEQHPTGTAFDGASDIMVSEAFTPAGTVSTRFARLGAILRVKVSNATLNDEKILSLSVTAENELVGNANVNLSDASLSGLTGGSSTVTATYEPANQFTVGAAEKYVYLIVYPQELTAGSTLTISGETENTTFSRDITLPNKIVLNPGHIVPLNVTLASYTPKDKVFLDARFDDNHGTGGNDGNWSGTIASNDIVLPAGWPDPTNGKGADRCVKFGTGSAGGSLTTEAISVPSAYSSIKLHFKAGAWDGSKEGTSLSISSTEPSKIKDNLDNDVSTVTLVKGEWTEYDYIIKNITGDVAITFSTSGGNKRFFLDDVIVYYGASVPKKGTGLAYAVTDVAKTYGDTGFTNELTNPNSLAVSYSSSDTGVATVNSSTGAVTIVKAGTTRISATFAGNEDYTAGSAYYDLTVSKASTGLAYAVETVTKNVGDANFTNLLTNPHSLSVSYASTDDNVAEVNASTGEVTIKASGSTLISASFAENDCYLEGEAFYELTVKKAIKTMAFAYSSVDVDKDDSVILPSLTILDSEDNDISGEVTVVYTSSNDVIAEEDSGEVLGYKPGHVTLTASITGDAVYNDKSTSIDVFVLGDLAAPTGVTLTTLNQAALAASWTAAVGAESYSWELINTSTSAVAKSGTTTETSLDIDYSADNVPAGTYKLSVVSTLSSSHAGINNSAAGESGTKTVTSSVTISIDLDSSLGLSSGTAFTSTSSTPITLTGNKGSNSNGPKYYSSGDAVRFYGGNTLSVSTTIGTIKTIVVTYGSKTNAIKSASVGSLGSYDSGEKTQTWTGSAASVTLTFNGSSGNDQIKQVSVTYE